MAYKAGLSLAAVWAWALVSAGSVQADTILFTDRASFNAQTVGQQLITFEGLAPPAGFAVFPFGLTQLGVEFHGVPTNRLFVFDPSYDPSLFWNSGDYLQVNNFPGVLNVTLPPGITAIGTDVSDFNPGTATFLLSTGESFTIPLAVRPNFAFAGFISDVPITSLSITTTGGGAVTIDNFGFGQAVPEPASFTLLGIAAIGLIGCCLRIRKRAT